MTIPYKMISQSELEQIYYARPFSIRNADEYNLESILDLFVDPTEGLIGPFDFSNVIIKGKMGSGKTMYLRANYANFLHTLVPCLMNKLPIILPVYIRLSDFQHFRDPEKIYEVIIVRIIEEIVSVIDHLRSSEELAKLHLGAQTIPGTYSRDSSLIRIARELRELTAEEYVEKVSSSINAGVGLTSQFFNAYADYKESNVVELKNKRSPTFSDVVNVCKNLVEPYGGKLLILFDEVGSLSKSFFRSDDNGDSYFESLMNQLRTISYVRTKLAVYPNTSSDILKETRYGDVVLLEADVVNHPDEYDSCVIKTMSLIERYINGETQINCSAEDVFEISTDNQLLIEQLVNASSGNMRRIVHLLDSSMNEGFKRNQGKGRVVINDVIGALKKQGADMESLYQSVDVEFLNNLSKLCKNRSTYRFSYPNKTPILNKYMNNSEEYNIIEIAQSGAGRKGNVYCFDYAYCVYKDLPTHYIKNSEKIDKSRSRAAGEPIRRVAQLTDEHLFQSALPGKIDGVIGYLSDNTNNGFIKGDQL